MAMPYTNTTDSRIATSLYDLSTPYGVTLIDRLLACRPPNFPYGAISPTTLAVVNKPRLSEQQKEKRGLVLIKGSGWLGGCIQVNRDDKDLVSIYRAIADVHALLARVRTCLPPILTVHNGVDK